LGYIEGKARKCESSARKFKQTGDSPFNDSAQKIAKSKLNDERMKTNRHSNAESERRSEMKRK